MDLHSGRRTVCLCLEPRSRASDACEAIIAPPWPSRPACPYMLHVAISLLLSRAQSHFEQGKRRGSSLRLGLCAIAQAGF